MAYHQYADGPHGYGPAYDYGYHHSLDGFAATSGGYHQHIDVDASNYHPSPGRSFAHFWRPGLTHRNGSDYSRDAEDYISHSTMAHVHPSYSEYISDPPMFTQYHAPPPAPAYEIYHTAPSTTTDYMSSPLDKSNYQIIKEGGWANKFHFMESHGLRAHEMDDFDEANELLDAYRRVDAQAAREDMYEPNYDSQYAGRYGREQEEYENASEACSDFISDYGEEDSIIMGSGYVDLADERPGEAPDRYDSSSVGDYEGERGHVREYDGEYSSSEYDGTDAIEYFSDSDSGEDEDIGGDEDSDDEYDVDY